MKQLIIMILLACTFQAGAVSLTANESTATGSYHCSNIGLDVKQFNWEFAGGAFFVEVEVWYRGGPNQDEHIVFTSMDSSDFKGHVLIHPNQHAGQMAVEVSYTFAGGPGNPHTIVSGWIDLDYATTCSCTICGGAIHANHCDLLD